jgi:predicted RNA-binding Zn ribbon-like protein
MGRPPAIFVGDAPGLDFLNSIATPADAQIDWIGDAEGFVSWLRQARLVPTEVLEDIRTGALPSELESVAGLARGLREWFRAFVHEHSGRPLDADDLVRLEPLNHLLGQDDSFTRIVSIPADLPTPFQIERIRRWRTPESLLLPIGEALAHLVSTEDFTYVKTCEGAACTLLFADHTRGHTRRWCSMAMCGNRAKQAAHRHRSKADIPKEG